MKLNKKAILTSVVALTMLLGTSTVHAAIQSSGGTVANKDAITWMKSIRQMEGVGGGFGLSETINSNLTSSSGSNNIDVHMEKNTEYGAMAILSASSYGNPTKIEDGQTTTGNETGIVMKMNQEWVAAGTIKESTLYYNAAGKYKNVYNHVYASKIGDTISETAGWHGSDTSTWLTCYNGNDIADYYNGLLRSYSKSIFSYYGYSILQASSQYSLYAAYLAPHPTRCVVIVGEGI